MVVYDRQLLESIRERIAHLLHSGNRLLACGLSLGAIFCVMAVYANQFIKAPEQALHLQDFMFNASEFAQAEQSWTELKPGHSLEKQKPVDPNWDGTLAGISLGITVGRSIPVVGYVLGPIAGAMIGYQLDSKI